MHTLTHTLQRRDDFSVIHNVCIRCLQEESQLPTKYTVLHKQHKIHPHIYIFSHTHSSAK
jgi:hypothetical protein